MLNGHRTSGSVQASDVFFACLDDISRTLYAQVRLTRGCVYAIEETSPAFRETIEQAAQVLATAIDDFKVDMRKAAIEHEGWAQATYEKSSWLQTRSSRGTGGTGTSIRDSRASLNTITESDRQYSSEYGDIEDEDVVLDEPTSQADERKTVISRRSINPAEEPPVEPAVLRISPSAIAKRVPRGKVPLRETSLEDLRFGEATSPLAASSIVIAPRKRSVATKREPSMAHVPTRLSEFNPSYGQQGSGARQFFDPDDGEDGPKGRCVEGVWNPNWSGRLAWDMFVIVLVLCDSMALPFQLSYKDGDSADGFDVFWLGWTTTLFAIDMLMSFTTGYVAGKRDLDVEPGKLITDKGRIARHYLRSWFLVDFVSTVPFSNITEAISGGDGGSGSGLTSLTRVVKFVRFLRLMRMLRLAKLATIWERVEAKVNSMFLLQIVALLRSLFVLMAICHWNACIWWMVGQPRSMITELLSTKVQEEWERQAHWTTIQRSHGILPGSSTARTWTWLERERSDAYIFSVYWTLGVMRTMPAEVQPANKVERLYVLIFMFFAFSAFAISVAMVTQTFFKLSERKRLFNDDMAAVRMYMRRIGVNDITQGRIKSYYRHLFDKRRSWAKENAVLDMVPQYLRDKLKHTAIAPLLQKLDILQGLSSGVLATLSNIVENKDMLAGELVSIAGSEQDAAWVLASGRLAKLFTTDHHEKIEVVNGECLTTKAELKCSWTIVTVLCSELLRLGKSAFFKVVRENIDLEKHIQASSPEYSATRHRGDLTDIGGGTGSGVLLDSTGMDVMARGSRSTNDGGSKSVRMGGTEMMPDPGETNRAVTAAIISS